MITLNRIKFLASLHQKKFRIEHAQTVVEGLRVIRQMMDNGLTPEELYFSQPKPEYNDIIDRIDADRVFQLDTRDFSRITETRSPQGIAALFPIVPKPLNERNFLLYLDRVSDPGNMGAIMRTAAAAGVDGIVLSPECCEATNPKVVRASLGASMFMPVEIHDAKWLTGFESVLAADMNGENIFEVEHLPCPLALVIGSEAHGISPEVLSLCTKRLSIPMTDHMESLNAAVSSAILIYEIRRKNF